MGKILKEDEVFNAPFYRKGCELVKTEELGPGSSILIGPMKASERIAYILEGQKADKSGKIEGLQEKLIILCAKNEDGSQLFTHKDSIVRLGKLPGTVIDRLAEAGLRVNGLDTVTEEEREKK